MARLLFLLAIAGAGVGLSVQAAANARMGSLLTVPTAGALVNFLVGTVALAAVTFSGVFGRAEVAEAASAPWWAWIGGLLGATYISLTVIAVPRVGAALTFAAVIAGQLVGSVLLDSTGWLGVPKMPVSATRILGVLLLFAGVLLVQRG